MTKKQELLLLFMAKACNYAQEHIDCPDAWGTDEGDRENRLQCVSYQMACFLSQNTKLGHEGVEWGVVIKPLSEHPAKTEKRWKRILMGLVDELGGWK